AEEVWGSALHAARSLGRAGIPVYMATAGHGAAIYRRSRYCTAAADFEFGDHVGFCRAVQGWVESLSPEDGPVPVIPLSDRLVECLDVGRDVFSSRFKLSIPSRGVVGGLLDKAESLQVAERAGLNVPRWTLVSDVDDLGKTEDLRLPVAVRPTRWSTVGRTYFKITVHTDRQTLRLGLASMLAQGAKLIVQEYVDEPDDHVEFGMLWRSTDQSVTVVCTGRKRRQAAAEGGVMVWGEAVPLPAVEDAGLRFVAESQFTGLGGIELIRSDAQHCFIEFNPRLEAIHFLAARAGIDTVLMAYRELALGEMPDEISGQGLATAWVGSAALNRFVGDPTDWRLILNDWWRFWRSPNRVRAVWSRGDPAPGLALARRLAYRGTASLGRRRRPDSTGEVA
ncbi:MAG: hypothetical protein JXA57_20170, partial [Armatimonadetes bacterium]|nr:hypothetical protein [Armatimonadota bacterium]